MTDKKTDTIKNRPRRGRGRPSAHTEPVASREEFLVAALNAFADLGYESASMRELSRRLNVSPALIIARFGSKHSLWKAAVDLGVRRLFEKVEAARLTSPPNSSFAQRLKNVYVPFLLALNEAPAIARMMNLEGQHDSDRLRYIVDSYMTASSFEGHTVLAEGKSSGAFRDVSPAIMLFLLAHGGGAVFSLGSLATLLFGANLGDAPQSPVATAEAIADILIEGIVARSSAETNSDSAPTSTV